MCHHCEQQERENPQDTTVVNSITERPTSAVSHYSGRCRRLPFIMEEQGKSVIQRDTRDVDGLVIELTICCVLRVHNRARNDVTDNCVQK